MVEPAVWRSTSGKPEPTQADRFVTELLRDPHLKERMEEKEKRRQQRVQENLRAVKPLADELNALGFQVVTVSDLFNHHYDYRAAIPLLLDWLPGMENDDVRESVVRALSVKWARPVAAPLLIEQFQREKPGGVRWAVGNALAVVTDQRHLDDILALTAVKEYGDDRAMLLIALSRIGKGDPRVIPAVESALEYRGMAGTAIRALGVLRAKQAARLISSFLEDNDPWFRNEARKALTKIG